LTFVSRGSITAGRLDSAWFLWHEGTYVVAFLLIAAVTGEVLSATALLIEEIWFRR